MRAADNQNKVKKMATQRDHEETSSDELSSEHSIGSRRKRYSERSRKSQKRARRMPGSESDEDIDVQFVHDTVSLHMHALYRLFSLAQAFA